MQCEGKVALVTGGASGLGRATVQALVDAGASVVVADLAGSAGESVSAALGHRVTFAATDVTSEADVEDALDAAVDRFGGLDIAVSCAGVATPGRVLGSRGTMPLEQFSTVVAVNLVGTFNVLRLAAARMVELGDRGARSGAGGPRPEERGVIVNTASIAAFEGQVGQTAYAASKAGIVGLTLPAARELAEHRIRVMAIAPGTFDTPMLAGLPEETRESLAAAIPHPRRLGRPGEFAALVRQVVENPLLNGEVIRLDGALRMASR